MVGKRNIRIRTMFRELRAAVVDADTEPGPPAQHKWYLNPNVFHKARDLLHYLLSLERVSSSTKMINTFDPGMVVTVVIHELEGLQGHVKEIAVTRPEPELVADYEDMNEELDAIYQWIIRHGTAASVLKLKREDMEVGTLCVGYVDGAFRRAIIAEDPGPWEKMVICFLPDQSRKALILALKLYAILDYFTVLPGRVFRIALGGIGTLAETPAFENIVSHGVDLTGELRILITLDPFNHPWVPSAVVYSSKYPGTSINQVVQEQLFKVLDPRNEVPEEGLCHREAYVVEGNDLGVVYIRLLSPLSTYLKWVLEFIPTIIFEQTAGFEETLPSVSTMCIVAVGPRNDKYCRAICLEECEDGPEFRVRLIDYGTEVFVNKFHLTRAEHFDPKISQIPPLVVTAHLANISSMQPGRFMGSFDFLKPVIMRVLKKSPKFPVEVALYTERGARDGFRCINSELLASGVGNCAIAEEDCLPLPKTPECYTSGAESAEVLPGRIN